MIVRHTAVIALLFFLSATAVCQDHRNSTKNEEAPQEEKQLLLKAEAGDPESQFQLGRLYARRLDYPKAAQRYLQAAEKGHLKAQNSLGLLYSTGKGVTKNEVTAVDWFRKAAERGEANAQFHLGQMYWSGRGTPQNRSEAARWFRKASDLGNSKAQGLLAMAYLIGEGVPRNNIEAVKWLEKSAEQGESASQFALGIMYSEGRGIDRDDVLAYSWFLCARALGFNKDSEGRVDSLSKKMSAEQIAEAERRASEWWNSHKDLATKYHFVGNADSQTQQGSPLQPNARSPVHSPQPRFAPTDCDSDHWVQSVSENGEVITLEDGSVWRVEAGDTVDSMLWLPTDAVIACHGYLINSDEGEKVTATRIK